MRIKNDVLTQTMKFPLLQTLESFCKKNKSVLLYLIFGGLAFLVNIGTYAVFDAVFHIPVLIANGLSWIITVLFAFFTNRIWVFQSPTKNHTEFVRQLFLFFIGRIVTLIVEELIILIFITLLLFPSIPVKIGAQVIVIISNYFISKAVVFKKTRGQ